MASDNLSIPAVSASQTQKEVTINDGINALDNAANGVLPITITTHRTLTATEFTRNVMFNLSGSPAADFNLVVPGTNRLFAVRNGTSKVCTVKYAASGSLTLAAGVSALVHSDGTSLVSLGGGGGGGGASTLLDLTDGPGSYAGAATYKVVVNGAGTGFEFVPDSGGGGTDYISRAGATRFVVLGTFNASADAGAMATRNVVVTDPDGLGCARNNGEIVPMTGATAFSMYCEVHTAALPSSTVDLMRLEGNTTGDVYIYLQITSTGALTLPRDPLFGGSATSSAGVIVANTHHKVVVTIDGTSSGGVIKVYVDGTEVINSTTTATFSVESDQHYQIGKSATGLNWDDTWFSRFAVWSTNLSAGDADALSVDGNISGYEAADLRGYWPLDETSGNAIADIGGLDLLLANSAAWGTASAFSPAAAGEAARVGASGTGAFTGHNNQIAVMTDTGWEFLAQLKGRQCYDQTASTETLWNGSAWV
jgi:hypothetical protein